MDATCDIQAGICGFRTRATARDVLTGCCAGCAVPVGLFKAMQVAAGLALPQNITIRLEDANG